MAAILDNLTGSTNIILKGDHQRGIWPKFGFIPSSVSEEERFQRFPIFQQIRSHGCETSLPDRILEEDYPRTITSLMIISI